jgi:nucleotide-binding universal stress UspA family protein
MLRTVWRIDPSRSDGGLKVAIKPQVMETVSVAQRRITIKKRIAMKMNISKKSGNARRHIGVSQARTKLREILATTDFSDESRAGVRYAVALAEKLGAAVALLHVVEPTSQMAGIEAVPITGDGTERTTLARAQLKKLAQRASGGGLRLTPCLRTGIPFHEITGAARERAADLIVIATHGNTGTKRVLLGSTAERVVRHAPCPVLTVRTPTSPGRTGRTPPLKLSKILVPIDFSDLSKGALPWATFLVAHFGAELILLHVTKKFPIDYLLGRELMNETIVPLMKQAEADLELMAASLSKSTGLNASVVVRDGAPFEEICHAAKTLGADLIVLTTHGYTGLKHVWLGSTAERVVRHAPCPVLVVRERELKTIERVERGDQP